MNERAWTMSTVATVAGALVIGVAPVAAATRTATTHGAAAAPDGVLHLGGRFGDLQLVRAATVPTGVVDAVYRVRGGRLERIHVDGPFGDALVTALVGRAYIDVDCGAGAGTVVQVLEEPVGRAWRETLLTFSLRGRRLTLTGASRAVVAEPRGRRCAIRGRRGEA